MVLVSLLKRSSAPTGFLLIIIRSPTHSVNPWLNGLWIEFSQNSIECSWLFDTVKSSAEQSFGLRKRIAII
jgi:hypothetical protein